MKILLITFSGTGNTTICGDFILEHFKVEGHEVEHFVYKADKEFNYDVASYDLIGFGYPIHAFNAPEMTIKFIKKLPKVSGVKYFIYKVSGEPFPLNNASSHHMYRLLKRKGYTLYAEKHFLMPYNIMFRYNDAIAKQMYLYLSPLTKAFVLGILKEEPERIKFGFFNIILSVILRIEWIAPFCNAPFVRVKKDKCIGCHKCINECPTGAMHVNKKGQIRIKATKCAMCMRCAMFCPPDAITYGFMNGWKVNQPFIYKKIVEDKAIAPEFINHDTKGYFRLFNRYFDRQKVLLEKYNIPNPIDVYRSK